MPPFSADKPGWKHLKVTVQVRDGKRFKGKRIDAQVMGPLAIHPCTVEAGRFTLTHLTSGLVIMTLSDRSEIEKAAGVILENCPLALYQRSQKDAVKHFPGPWLDWVRACRRADRVEGVPLPKRREVDDGESCADREE
jgi:hypothetical protein